MDRLTNAMVGSRIQDYVRAKWRRSDSIARLADLIDPALRARIDLLGIDDQRLLTAHSDKVLSLIEELERQARVEDAAVCVSGSAARSSSGLGGGGRRRQGS